MPVPKQRNSGDDNARIKEGETPEGWENQPAKRSQKDTDARWTKKHGKSHYGYKNHVNVDRRHKLVRRYQVTDAAVHDSQVVDDILDPDNTASEVWADSAYRSAEIEAKLKGKGPEEPDPPQGVSQQAAERAGEAGQHDPFEGAGARSSTCSGPRATTWAGRWCAASGWYGRGRGSG